MVVALLILKEVSPQPINFESIRGRAIEAGIDIKSIYDIGVDMFAFARATRSRDISEAMGVLPRG